MYAYDLPRTVSPIALFLQTPPRAAIKETVKVLCMMPNIPEPLVKFVNGVFRKLSRPPKIWCIIRRRKSLGMVLLPKEKQTADRKLDETWIQYEQCEFLCSCG